ncbi:hypothetical protein BCR35DRAFT_349209 [Leucosporidium creatinivorum]|uniref:Uncharacterized protein n=1 Tax=Leucosporidium creatinivorum TaxID=106004 RepID=A0A1Y2G4P6_9BASI|nr:hypothetical protein BCR35DRAFT_349209 [Leucosporidium creatinivorum]
MARRRPGSLESLQTIVYTLGLAVKQGGALAIVLRIVGVVGLTLFSIWKTGATARTDQIVIFAIISVMIFVLSGAKALYKGVAIEPVRWRRTALRRGFWAFVAIAAIMCMLEYGILIAGWALGPSLPSNSSLPSTMSSSALPSTPAIPSTIWFKVTPQSSSSPPSF